MILISCYHWSLTCQNRRCSKNRTLSITLESYDLEKKAQQMCIDILMLNNIKGKKIEISQNYKFCPGQKFQQFFVKNFHLRNCVGGQNLYVGLIFDVLQPPHIKIWFREIFRFLRNKVWTSPMLGLNSEIFANF